MSAAGGIAGRAAAVPVRSAGESLRNLIAGRRNVRGPWKGTRKKPVKGGPGVGMDPIPYDKYLAIRSGKDPGKAYAAVVNGRPHYFERKTRYGGAVGMAQKHPLIAGGLGLGGYMMLKSPGAQHVVLSYAGNKGERARQPQGGTGSLQGFAPNNYFERSSW